MRGAHVGVLIDVIILSLDSDHVGTTGYKITNHKV